MPNSYFQFKEFRIDQDQSGMKVTTEGCLLGALVAKWSLQNQPEKILDIGTGTGLLALMIAQKSSANIDAIEIDKAAARQAENNFQDSPWPERLNVQQGSIQSFTPSKRYDLIVSNPPFFKDNQPGKSTQKNQAIHNLKLSFPDLALAVGTLLKSETGTAWILYPPYEMEEFRKQASKQGLFPIEVVTVRNKESGSPFRKIVQFGFNESEINHRQLVIRNLDGSYTTTFKVLLQDFYLHL